MVKTTGSYKYLSSEGTRGYRGLWQTDERKNRRTAPQTEMTFCLISVFLLYGDINTQCWC